MAIDLAEILRKENIPVIAFVNALIGVQGVDAITRFANFKKLEQPFNDSKLNYKELKNKLGDAFEKLAKNVIFVPPSKETLAMLASFK